VTPPPVSSTSAELARVFEAASVDGYLYARDLGSGSEIGHRADDLVVLASVFKLAVLLELYRQAATGTVDLEERVTIPATRRTRGPTGISMMRHEVSMSWRDLAQIMIAVSDNTATDVVMERVGLESINALLARMGLSETRLVGDCKAVLAEYVAGCGVPIEKLLAGSPIELDPEVMQRNRALLPSLTTRGTPRQIARLLEVIWSGDLLSKALADDMRSILLSQVWPHRLRSGFAGDVRVAGKTGSLGNVRNEAGIVVYPDGATYAVAVFTRARHYLPHAPEADAVIGTAALMAVDELRAAAKTA